MGQTSETPEVHEGSTVLLKSLDELLEFRSAEDVI